MKKTAVRIVCFILILLMVLGATNQVFKMKYGDGIYNVIKFYELDDESVDVLFLGSSHAFQAFNTGVLWKEHGISSYVLGGSMQPMWNTYYYLKEALKTQKPRLVVLEGYMATYSADYMDASRIIKNNYGLKWSRDKIESIKVSAHKDRWMDYMLEYTQYHTRYTELSEEDFLRNQGNPLYEDWKGFGCNMITTPLEAIDVTGVTDRIELNSKTEEYYRKTIELAQANDIPLLIVISPYAGITVREQSMFNTVMDIAGEYDVPFINYNLHVNELGIDFLSDVADIGHLNYRGNQKFTKAFGDYITECYDIPDHRGDINYISWDRNAIYIDALIYNQKLLETYDINLIVEKILNKDYQLIITVDGTCSVNDEFLKTTFEVLGVTSNSDNEILYRDNVDGTVWRSENVDTRQYFRQDNHDISIERIYDENRNEYLNKVVIDNIECKRVDNGINIIIYDKITQDVIDVLGINVNDAYNIVR